MPIRLSTSMARQLRAFIETSGVPWGGVTVRHGDDGRVDAGFVFNGRQVEAYIIPPSQDHADRFNGELLMHGRLAGRVDGGPVVAGVIDRETWDRIHAEMFRDREPDAPSPATAEAPEAERSAEVVIPERASPIERVPEILEALFALDSTLTAELVEQLQRADIATLQTLFGAGKQSAAPATHPEPALSVGASSSGPSSNEEFPALQPAAVQPEIERRQHNEAGYRIGGHNSAFAHIRQPRPRGSGWV